MSQLRPNLPSTPLIEALRACKRHFVAAAGFSALLNLLYLAPTLYMLQVYDRVVPTQGKLTLVFLTIAVLGALGALSLLDMVRGRLLVRASIRLDRRLAGAVLDATLGRRGAQGLSKQAVRELDAFRQTLTGAGILAVFDAPWTPIYVIVCFIIHPLLGVLALMGASLLLIIALRNERATRAPLQRANEAANVAYVSQEYSTASADVVRAMGMRKAIVRRHLAERETMFNLQTQASFAASGYVTLTKFARLSLQSLALGAGALLAVNNHISPGAIFAASFLISRALAPIEQVLGAWKSLIQARGAYRTLTDLFVEEGLEPIRTQLPAPSGAVAVESLTVLNPRRDGAILSEVSFGVDAGEIVGIVGPSGAGKSTLVRMIAGAAAPDRGVIRLDGADRKDWDPERLGEHIGFMPQEATLFAGSIKSNICRFQNFTAEDPGAVDAAVIEAAQRSGAHEMILRLPQGYDTELALGGRGLSAGQAQRIALARALYGSPNLLILDEPNAHLDAEGEALLLETLSEVKRRGGTVLIVAHRTGVLAALDKLMVLRDGRLEIFGPRDAVLQRIGSQQQRPRTVEAQPAPSLQATPEEVH
ncbi:MAG TPA: type I secretion system permease/ATPase [Caulobacteraceae bacterium]|nr:type I secretion system permease/ATPase [Caulobacteraceae bacterium]